MLNLVGIFALNVIFASLNFHSLASAFGCSRTYEKALRFQVKPEISVLGLASVHPDMNNEVALKILFVAQFVTTI